MSSVVISGDTSGTVTLQAPAVAGSTVITLPSTSITLGAGSLLNIQYFTTAGTATYTATSGTNSVIVEVVGGGGGGSITTTSAGTGGTSSFGALVSATGGTGGTTTTQATLNAGGSGVSGDLNVTGTDGTSVLVGANQPALGIGGTAYIGTIGAGRTITNFNTSVACRANGGGGGGYARKKITSGFSGQTVTVGAAGALGGSGGIAGFAGAVIVYEYS